ncbi:MAG TPA: DMT family transporter [Kofleriaceae bacterium]|nr:DMT family transporter [Kofleriaceae bacterium]
MSPPGEVAALGTALCWTCSSLAFERATKRLGSLVVNLLRVTIAFGLLALIGTILRGHAIPDDANASQWTWLLASGAVGMALGDLCLFRAYVEIGARMTMLVQTLAPVFTALIGWAMLGEGLGARGAAGIALVVAGVAYAVADRAPRDDAKHAHPMRGFLLAVGGALGQAGGLVLSKRGLDGYDPVAATQIRVLAGIAGFAIVISAVGFWPRVRAAFRDPAGFGATSVGALFGPCLGVAFSLYAVAHTEAGVAAAIIATTPVWLLVIAIVRREPVHAGGIAGAVVAVGGVALLVTR